MIARVKHRVLARFVAATTVLVLSSACPATAGPCSGHGTLSNLGCAFYAILLIPSLLVPEFSMPVDTTRDAVIPGLLWEVPFAIDDTGWLHHPFISIAYYPGYDEVTGRVGYRFRLPLELEILHFYVGAGGFYGTAGGGPRAELRTSFGLAAGAGFYISGAYEPTFGDELLHRVEVSAGFEVPVVF